MIKKFGRLVLFLSLALLCAACSTEEAGESIEAQRDITKCFNTEGKAWLNLDFSLSMSVPSTRAANGMFSDGADTESAVKSLTLVLLHGSNSDSEDQMRVASTYDILYSPTTDDHQQITHHSEKTIEISSDNIEVGDQLYMLAIANAMPTMSVGTTFASLKQMILNGVTTSISGTEYFVMSSCPLATNNNGSGKTQTLTWIDPHNLYESPEEADANTSGAVLYLERAAVKVTVDTDAGLDYHVAGNTDIDFSRADFWYSLFNYNTDYYLVRHFNDSWLPYNASSTGYRFVEPVTLTLGKYRTNWARDPNYDNGNAMDAYFKQWNTMGISDYCAENTFDIAHMADVHTTSVVIALGLNGGEDFYTTSVTGSDVIYQAPSTTISEEGTSAEQSFAPRRSSKVSSTKPIDEYLREWLMQTHSQLRQWVHDYAGGEARYLKIAVSGNATTGLATATVTQTARTTGDGVTYFAKLGLDTYLANNIVIRYYNVGLCYYRVPIKHFGDELTPWASAPAMTGYTPTAAYGDSDASYLGRYGVVRNNWYQINIRRVTHVGSPIVPPLTQEADDQVEQLLNATLTINNWTSHNQDL